MSGRVWYYGEIFSSRVHGSIGLTEGRDNTEQKSWIFPHIALHKEVQ